MIRKLMTPILALLLLSATTAGASAADPATASNDPAFEPAPVPNHDLFAPVQRANEEPQINPTVFRPGTQFRGDGLLPGSTSQSYEERHMLPGAGLNLLVPLK